MAVTLSGDCPLETNQPEICKSSGAEGRKLFRLRGFMSVSPGWSQKWRKGWAGREPCGSEGGLRRRCAKPGVTPSQGGGCLWGLWAEKNRHDSQWRLPGWRAPNQECPRFSLSQPDPEDKSVLVLTFSNLTIYIQQFFFFKGAADLSYANRSLS